MAEEEGTPDLGQPDVTVTKYLYQFQTPLYEGRGQFAVEDSLSGSTTSGSVFLAPKHQGLPMVSAQARKTPHGGAVAFDIGLPSDLLRARRGWTFGDTPTTTSTFESKLGPASLYYKTQEQPGSEADMRSQEFGGRLDVGPFSVGGSRMETSQEIMPEKFRRHYEDPRHRFWQDMGWLRGEADILGGAGRFNLQRTWSGERQPGYEGKHPPVTEAELSYERALGPGTIAGTARGQMVRDRGEQYGADLLYRFPWLGGKASLSGEFTGRQLPTAQYPMGQPSGWKVGAEWKKRF